MSEKENPQSTTSSSGSWSCARCSVPLETGKVSIAYLGSMFPVDLLKCPICSQVFIPEDLANGRMAKVEELLEDK